MTPGRITRAAAIELRKLGWEQRGERWWHAAHGTRHVLDALRIASGRL